LLIKDVQQVRVGLIDSAERNEANADENGDKDAKRPSLTASRHTAFSLCFSAKNTDSYQSFTMEESSETVIYVTSEPQKYPPGATISAIRGQWLLAAV